MPFIIRRLVPLIKIICFNRYKVEIIDSGKGINKKDATKLIVDGFLKSNLKENN